MQPFSLPPSLVRTLWCSQGCQFTHFSTAAAASRKTRIKSKLPAPSRTRLVRDLKPKSASRTSGRLEIASTRNNLVSATPFIRDKAPHSSRAEKSSTKFRRDPKVRNERDWRRAGGDNRRSSHSNQCPSKSQPTKRIRPNSSTGGTTKEASRLAGLGQRPTPRGSQPQDQFYSDLSEVPQSSHRKFTHQHDLLPTHFTSPPLMSGLLDTLKDVLGQSARPTPIQTLSLKHLFHPDDETYSNSNTSWKQFLLASETGSGKSIAYLLPMLQDLKLSELRRPSTPENTQELQKVLNPRAVILAPTHELSRQLTGFAKSLLHVIKLRVTCASKANVKNPDRAETTASKMASNYQTKPSDSGDIQEDGLRMQEAGKTHPVDIVVGTPSRLLEMVRGRRWKHEGEKDREAEQNRDPREHEKHTQVMTRTGGKGEAQMGLGNVEWVVVDEADVLFDINFQESTRLLLADISAARGHPMDSSTSPSTSHQTHASPLNYPFNFVLASATIPSALASYLDTRHPTLTRLASPNLHRLPTGIKPEYVSWTGGNRNADVERRIKRVWAEDILKTGNVDKLSRSKILIFCNKTSKVADLGKYLTEKRISNIALTSTSDARKRGSNHHLDGFLKRSVMDPDPARHTPSGNDDEKTAGEPDVMITTSLLSRGLDFSPIVKHVFIVDEPRNMVDFLHRAGRTGRAGQTGKVVIFGKLKGRQSAKARGMKKKVIALAA